MSCAPLGQVSNRNSMVSLDKVSIVHSIAGFGSRLVKLNGTCDNPRLIFGLLDGDTCTDPNLSGTGLLEFRRRSEGFYFDSPVDCLFGSITNQCFELKYFDSEPYLVLCDTQVYVTSFVPSHQEEFHSQCDFPKMFGNNDYVQFISNVDENPSHVAVLEFNPCHAVDVDARYSMVEGSFVRYFGKDYVSHVDGMFIVDRRSHVLYPLPDTRSTVVGDSSLFVWITGGNSTSFSVPEPELANLYKNAFVKDQQSILVSLHIQSPFLQTTLHLTLHKRPMLKRSDYYNYREYTFSLDWFRRCPVEYVVTHFSLVNGELWKYSVPNGSHNLDMRERFPRLTRVSKDGQSSDVKFIGNIEDELRSFETFKPHSDVYVDGVGNGVWVTISFPEMLMVTSNTRDSTFHLWNYIRPTGVETMTYLVTSGNQYCSSSDDHTVLLSCSPLSREVLGETIVNGRYLKMQGMVSYFVGLQEVYRYTGRLVVDLETGVVEPNTEINVDRYGNACVFDLANLATKDDTLFVEFVPHTVHGSIYNLTISLAVNEVPKVFDLSQTDCTEFKIVEKMPERSDYVCGILVEEEANLGTGLDPKVSDPKRK